MINFCLSANVLTRKARSPEDDLKKRDQANTDISSAGSTKQLDEIAEAVKKIQDELQSDGEGEAIVLAYIHYLFIHGKIFSITL